MSKEETSDLWSRPTSSRKSGSSGDNDKLVIDMPYPGESIGPSHAENAEEEKHKKENMEQKTSETETVNTQQHQTLEILKHMSSADPFSLPPGARARELQRRVQKLHYPNIDGIDIDM